jgi:TolA-binding protein
METKRICRASSATRLGRRGFILAALVLLASMPVMADTVSIRGTDEADSVAPIVYTDVKITNIQGHSITFSTPSGNNVQKNLATVVAMTIDDEPQFNQAQQDYAANRLNPAIDELSQTIQKTDKPWLNAYCEPMLTDAANKAGRFDLAAQGYAFLVLNDPSSAAALRPSVPQSDSPYLDPAAKALSDAANTAGISGSQQTQLLSLLLDVDRQRKDTAGMEDAANRLTQLAGDAGSSTANIASLALADAKIADASTAISQKDFDRAASIITGSGNLFVDVRHQSDALYLLAQARQGQAEARNGTGAWQDAAIAYMRVAADFKDAPNSPHVAASLLQAARILQNHLNQAPSAMRMYQSIVSQYPSTVPAQQAAEQIAKLQPPGNGSGNGP